MNRNFKKLLCALAAMLLLAGCRSGGGGETTLPSETLPQQTTAPTATAPNGEGVEDWNDPIETEPVDPIETTGPQTGDTQAPAETTEPSIDGGESTQTPQETTPQTEPAATQPPAPPSTTEPQSGGSDPTKLTYEEYLAMSPAEQQAHYEQFASLEAYIAWHNEALAVYEENQNSIEVTGPIDIGDFVAP